MRITHENIDEVLFIYHEGDLNNDQKAELMEYLYQNPEYNKEFSLWAQVRLSNQQLPIPKFAEALKQKPMSWHLTLWKSLGFASIIAITGIILIWMVSRQEKNKQLVVNILENKKKNITLDSIIENNPAKNAFPRRKSKTYSKNSLFSTSNLFEHRVDSVNFTENQRMDSISNPSEAKVLEIKLGVAAEIDHKPIVEETRPLTTSGHSVKPAQRKKTIQKISLKPTSDILPTNTNF